MFLLIIAQTHFGLRSWPSSGRSYVLLVCAAYIPTYLAEVLVLNIKYSCAEYVQY